MPSHKPKSIIPNPRKPFSKKNLHSICKNFPEKAHKAPGIDGVTPKVFTANLDKNINSISNDLLRKKFKFCKLRAVPIKKSNGKKRIICIPTIRDRLVQRLLLHLLLETDKLAVKNKINFGSLKGEDSGYHQAIKKALTFRTQYNWVLKTDIAAFFDTIDRDHLINMLKRKLKASPLIPLLEQAINCEIYIQDKDMKLTVEKNGIKIGRGLRQGMPLSPLLSSFFLKKFDAIAIKKALNIIRYVDDIIVFCNSEKECFKQKKLIEDALKKVKLGIPSLNEVNSKTEIISPNDPFVCLGIEIYKSKNGKYLTKIPQKKIEEILSELDEYGSYLHCLKENHTYFSLTRLLKNKETGYKSSYRDTTNLENFLLQLKEKKGKIKNKLLTDILGIETFNFLSEDKRKFLCIDL